MPGSEARKAVDKASTDFKSTEKQTQISIRDSSNTAPTMLQPSSGGPIPNRQHSPTMVLADSGKDRRQSSSSATSPLGRENNPILIISNSDEDIDTESTVVYSKARNHQNGNKQVRSQTDGNKSSPTATIPVQNDPSILSNGGKIMAPTKRKRGPSIGVKDPYQPATKKPIHSDNNQGWEPFKATRRGESSVGHGNNLRMKRVETEYHPDQMETLDEHREWTGRVDEAKINTDERLGTDIEAVRKTAGREEEVLNNARASNQINLDALSIALTQTALGASSTSNTTGLSNPERRANLDTPEKKLAYANDHSEWRYTKQSIDPLLGSTTGTTNKCKWTKMKKTTLTSQEGYECLLTKMQDYTIRLGSIREAAKRSKERLAKQEEAILALGRNALALKDENLSIRKDHAVFQASLRAEFDEFKKVTTAKLVEDNSRLIKTNTAWKNEYAALKASNIKEKEEYDQRLQTLEAALDKHSGHATRTELDKLLMKVDDDYDRNRNKFSDVYKGLDAHSGRLRQLEVTPGTAKESTRSVENRLTEIDSRLQTLAPMIDVKELTTDLAMTNLRLTNLDIAHESEVSETSERLERNALQHVEDIRNLKEMTNSIIDGVKTTIRDEVNCTTTALKVETDIKLSKTLEDVEAATQKAVNAYWTEIRFKVIEPFVEKLVETQLDGDVKELVKAACAEHEANMAESRAALVESDSAMPVGRGTNDVEPPMVYEGSDSHEEIRRFVDKLGYDLELEKDKRKVMEVDTQNLRRRFNGMEIDSKNLRERLEALKTDIIQSVNSKLETEAAGRTQTVQCNHSCPIDVAQLEPLVVAAVEGGLDILRKVQTNHEERLTKVQDSELPPITRELNNAILFCKRLHQDFISLRRSNTQLSINTTSSIQSQGSHPTPNTSPCEQMLPSPVIPSPQLPQNPRQASFSGLQLQAQTQSLTPLDEAAMQQQQRQQWFQKLVEQRVQEQHQLQQRLQQQQQQPQQQIVFERHQPPTRFYPANTVQPIQMQNQNSLQPLHTVQPGQTLDLGHHRMQQMELQAHQTSMNGGGT